ncbi:unnamed protein product, partial [marine sediment metagenome]
NKAVAMPTWTGDLEIEEARLRVLYKLLHGLVDEDIRDLHIPGDVRTKLKEDLEIKGWNRNGWLPLETWSKLERGKPGWAWTSAKLNVWFVRGEEEEALGIRMEAIRDFLRETTIPLKEELRCSCGKPFVITKHDHPLLVKQGIQWTDHEKSHKYHSACLFVEPEAFPMRHYLGRPPVENITPSHFDDSKSADKGLGEHFTLAPLPFRP